MRALIIGAGVAGTATAVALAEVGIVAEIYEAYDVDSEGVGAWLTLAGNGIDALAALDLANAVTRHGFPTPLARMSNHTGRVIGELAMGSPRADGLEVHTMRRSDLYRELRDGAAERGIRIRYGKRLVQAGDSPCRGVRAQFDDGTRADGDLLVGADGLWSTVRRIIDPAAPPARFTPLLNTGGYARGLRLDPEPGVLQFCFGRRCFLGYVTDPDGLVWWFANPRVTREMSRDELASIDPDRWRAWLRELFAGDNLPAAELINATEHVFSGWGTYDLPFVPVWHRRNMIVVGDAAHATSPAAGQGASMAAEDAVSLARALRDQSDIGPAFTAYERERRARVERVVALGNRNGAGKTVGPVRRVLRDRVVVPYLSASGASRFVRPDPWLHQYRVEW